MNEYIASFGLPGVLLLIAGGFAMLIIGGEVLVRGASRLALAMRISPLIIGLTIVAFCTGAPELAVCMIASLKGQGDLAVGNIFGSCISNILLILGLCALFKPLTVLAKLIRQEIPLLLVISVLVCGYAFFFGVVSAWLGGILTALLFVYLAWTIRQVRREADTNSKLAKEIKDEVLGGKKDSPEEFGSKKGIILGGIGVLFGLALLVMGSDSLVFGATTIAVKLGVTQRIIGLTLIAVGTSLPELAVTLAAAMKGEADMAIGNVIGSNIFNLLGVLGPTAILSGGLNLPRSSVIFDLPVMVLTTACCLWVCKTDLKLTRLEGLFLLACYIAYIGFLVFFC